MSVWGRIILPRLLDLVMRSKADAVERARLVPLASGRVLEIGIGSALNVRYYTSDVRHLVGVPRRGSYGASDVGASAPPRFPFAT